MSGLDGLPPFVASVAEQLQALAQSVGTGVLPAGGPVDSLRNSASSIDAAHGSHRDGIGRLTQSLNGEAGEAALNRALAVQNSATQLSERGTAMATVLNNASTDVNAASLKLGGIAQDFVDTAAKAAPELGTGTGIAMIAEKARENLGQAIGVINDTRTRLTDHANAMQDLASDPEEVPGAIRPGAPPPPLPSVLRGLPPPAQSLITEGEQLAGRAAGSASRILGTVGDAVHNAINDAENAGRNAPRRLPPAPRPPAPLPNSGSASGFPGVRLQLPDGSVTTAPNERAAVAVRAALTQNNRAPYVWGGNDPVGSPNNPSGGFDCSGLTHWAYQQAGVELPRTADAQATGEFIGTNQHNAMPGDLVVWTGHVAMYVGNGKMIEAPTFGETVHVTPFRTGESDGSFLGIFRPTA